MMLYQRDILVTLHNKIHTSIILFIAMYRPVIASIIEWKLRSRKTRHEIDKKKVYVYLHFIRVILKPVYYTSIYQWTQHRAIDNLFEFCWKREQLVQGYRARFIVHILRFISLIPDINSIWCIDLWTKKICSAKCKFDATDMVMATEMA